MIRAVKSGLKTLPIITTTFIVLPGLLAMVMPTQQILVRMVSGMELMLSINSIITEIILMLFMSGVVIIVINGLAN